MTVSVKIRGSTSIFMRWHRITSSTLLTGQQIVTVVRTGVPDDHLCHVSNILPNGNNVLRGRQVVRLHYLCIMKISVSYAFLHRYAFASKVAAVTERGIVINSRCRPSDIWFEQEVVGVDVSPKEILEWAFKLCSIYFRALFEIVTAPVPHRMHALRRRFG